MIKNHIMMLVDHFCRFVLMSAISCNNNFTFTLAPRIGQYMPKYSEKFQKKFLAYFKFQLLSGAVWILLYIGLDEQGFP